MSETNGTPNGTPSEGNPAAAPAPMPAGHQKETPPVPVETPVETPKPTPDCGGTGCENCPGKTAAALIEKLQGDLAALSGKINAAPAPVDYAPQLDAVQKYIKAVEAKAEQAVKLAGQTAPPVPAAETAPLPADPVAAFVRASIAAGN